MAPDPQAIPQRRADATRNREKILVAARGAFDDPEAGDVSMAEVARRAGVGMATLYRNFPGRRQLLEAVLTDEVGEVCAAAAEINGQSAGDSFAIWTRRFFDFAFARNAIATELIFESGVVQNAFFTNDRARLCAAGLPLLAAAQASGEFRSDLDIGQMLDLIAAVARIRGNADHVRPIAEAALDGLRTQPPTPKRASN
ncbi:TetR/AcrR family transcriptional regulator [Mycolicibacterium mengxianglii]|uniref:TetR/AcrR family transcriptional regulator n=1 Tax=Mycolicibacterium mengxianglii TaxID=2736649 RepID=UPI0018D19119|nr:TetR/AcrR family transcriptional regulator [Mycolicibacterium mengxianglii]